MQIGYVSDLQCVSQNFDGFRSSFEIRELKHGRFGATDVKRESKLLLFDLYNSLFAENNKS